MRFTRSQFVTALLFLGGAGLALLCTFDPATSGIFPPCPLRYLTGWYCPGCGSLRAMHQLLHGHLRQAWALNPMAVLLLPFLLYGLTSETLREFRGRGLPQFFLPAIWIRGICAAIVLFGIARNLPIHPFELLHP